ncbi:Metallo-dependent phosphatase-like protein [Clohesyomyces aquaticus]|uniref:Metallo-dependent phosphatase-like protein n=1 Tax=Clohesyomyces aquaticus TaxID=1231657 RepID=A0A1Y1ZYR6_9PLEO|nr:Metallo-dependent phosphatase-like protein [Clohesyomyces aquaticus]
MALQIISDLHLESPKAYDIYTIVPCAQHLALLGDIGTIAPHKSDFLAFLTRQLKQFHTVLFVPGNHETYISDRTTALGILRDFAESVQRDDLLGDFILLDRTAWKLPDSNVTILGCSLFSHGPPESEMAVSMGLNDFFQTQDWDVGMHNAAHRQDVDWLNAQVAALEQQHDDSKIIILTHWSPSTDPRSSDPKHAGSPISSAFSTDLSDQLCFRSRKVKVWAFGHTHYNCDFLVERGADVAPLRLVTNQRGYYFAQAKGCNGERTVNV